MKNRRLPTSLAVAAALVIGMVFASPTANAASFGGSWSCSGTRTPVVVANAYAVSNSIVGFSRYMVGGTLTRSYPARLGLNTYFAPSQSFNWGAATQFSSAYATCTS